MVIALLLFLNFFLGGIFYDLEEKVCAARKWKTFDPPIEWMWHPSVRWLSLLVCLELWFVFIPLSQLWHLGLKKIFVRGPEQ